MPSGERVDRRAVALSLAAATVAIAVGTVSHWPGWSISLVVIAAAAVVVAVLRWFDQKTTRQAVALVAVCCAGVLVAVSVMQFRERTDAADSRQLVESQGGRWVVDAFSYDSPQQRNAKADSFTGVMAVIYRSQMRDQLPERRRWQLARSGVVSAGRDRASVVVAANVTETIAGKQSTYGRVVDAQLRRVDGQWRIANVDVVV